MAVTTICEIRNMCSFAATVVNFANSKDTEGAKGKFAPGESRNFNMEIPWCGDGKDFQTRHIDVALSNVVVGKTNIGSRTFTVWQAAHGTLPDVKDRVRVSSDGNWHDPGDEIGGMSAVGVVEEFILQGDQRVLVITNDALWLLPVWLTDMLKSALSAAPPQLVWEAPVRSIPSVPKLSAVAHSMAGPASDAFDQGRAEARFLYRDSGKRYAFDIINGKVTAHPSVKVSDFKEKNKVDALTEAISFDQVRAGAVIPMPKFDLIAANGGRVFAKEQGTDRLFFAALDEMFIHAVPGQNLEFAVPSVYFKRDPELNKTGANKADLLKPLEGNFGGHPAAMRFAAYRTVLDSGFGAVVAKLRRGAWHLIDARPVASTALSRGLRAIIANLNSNVAFMQVFPSVVPSLTKMLSTIDNASPPRRTSYPDVRYKFGTGEEEQENSIDIRKVLDIGVGHVHYHQQYEGVTGGELQMLLAPFSNNPFFSDHASLYAFMNGPVVDLDGFNDGTCNYYILAQLADDSYALLYLDEQSLFSSRWRDTDAPINRICDGPLMSLLRDLASSPECYPRWNEAKYWSPFRVGLVGSTSRMAVSAQVVLISGDQNKEKDVLYSINFSWGTMDTTWRWRKLPAGAGYTYKFFASDADAGKEVIIGPGNTVFPQTIRLRDDMTIHVKGTRDGIVGRWYQRYLPASNQHVPPATELVAGQRPGRPYTHAWKFISEPLYQLADQFSQFGVYDQVNSRTQYYPVQPASDADAAALDKGAENPNDSWTDSAALYIQTYSFRVDTLPVPWPPFPPYKKDLKMAPASLFNPEMILRIVKRGPGWIAIRRDKRDDDFAAFTGLPQKLKLKSKLSALTAQVTLQPAVSMSQPPIIQKAFFWITGSQANLAFVATPGLPEVHSVFRIRMAALGTPPPLLTMTTPGALKASGGYWQYQWTPTAAGLANLKTYATPAGETQHATSIWFEDWTGHAVVAEEPISWAQPPMIAPKTDPLEITEDVPLSLTVHAQDAATSKPLQGKVKIDRVVMGDIGSPIKYTFQRKPHRVFDPDTQTWQTLTTLPVVSVAVDRYPETAVPLTISPVRVSVDPSAIAIGPPLHITVHAVDAATKKILTGKVKINNQEVADTDKTFTYTFSSTLPSAVVSVQGYKDTPVIWPNPHRAQLLPIIDPKPTMGKPDTFVVRGLDSVLRTTVEGSVSVDGKFVAQSGASFPYTFNLRHVGGVLVAPIITVSSTGYPDAEIQLDVGGSG